MNVPQLRIWVFGEEPLQESVLLNAIPALVVPEFYEDGPHGTPTGADRARLGQETIPTARDEPPFLLSLSP